MPVTVPKQKPVVTFYYSIYSPANFYKIYRQYHMNDKICVLVFPKINGSTPMQNSFHFYWRVFDVRYLITTVSYTDSLTMHFPKNCICWLSGIHKVFCYCKCNNICKLYIKYSTATAVSSTTMIIYIIQVHVSSNHFLCSVRPQLLGIWGRHRNIVPDTKWLLAVVR